MTTPSNSPSESKSEPSGVLRPNDGSTSAPPSLPAVPNKYEARKTVQHEGMNLHNQLNLELLLTGRTIYEWEQTLEEVMIYVTLPPGITKKSLDCKIETDHLMIGIKGNPPYLNEDLGGCCILSESFWTIDDGVLTFQLQKANPAETWPCACKGAIGQLNAVEAQQVQQKILLERFQREHPGFDFSRADFSGTAPDPRSFMGGLDHNKLNR